MTEVLAIPLHTRQGVVAFALVDPIDHLWACQYRWHWCNGYAARSHRAGGPKGKPERTFLHREIMGHKKSPRTVVIDHKNGDPLDCRRGNLRAGGHAMNAQNRRARTGASSKHKGVWWCARSRKWRAASVIGGAYRYLGQFDKEEDAAAAMAAFYAVHSPYQRQQPQDDDNEKETR